MSATEEPLSRTAANVTAPVLLGGVTTHHHHDCCSDLSFDNVTALLNDSDSGYCPTACDGVSCWYRTKAGIQAIIPCFASLNGVNYDTSENATRLCLANGTWSERANYDQCVPVYSEPIPVESPYTANIYYLGYGLSLVALLVALFILTYFKELRCVRNTIHKNLMVTYFLIAIGWIITDQLHSNPSTASQQASCITVIVLIYLMGTNFFWMFVEGLYLYILVVKTFSIEMINIINYILIGWGLPLVIVLCWALVKHYFSKFDSKIVQCPYQGQDEIDYIYKVPILVVLVVNIFFLGKIMWVLIIKLRASNSNDTKQYRKAAKALLVLIPLLGVGYMLILVTPTHPTAKVIFQYLQAILVSTQGFTVAVLYCFCNGEVRNCLRNHLERFRLRRTLRYGGEYPALQATYYRTTACWASASYSHGREMMRQRGHHHHHTVFRSCSGPAATAGRGSQRRPSGRNSADTNDSNLFHRNLGRTRDSWVSHTTVTSEHGPPAGNGIGPPGPGPGATIIKGSGKPTPLPHNNGYHSVPSTPEDDLPAVDEDAIEMQPL